MEAIDPSMPQPPQPQEPQLPPTRGRSCLVMILIAAVIGAVVCAGICGGLFYFGVETVKNTPAYRMALAQVQESPEVTERLGRPVEEAGWVPAVQMNVGDGQGSATMDFDVQGPEGRAHVRCQARMIGGTWGLTLLEVTFADGERVVLDTGDRADEEAPKWTPPKGDSDAEKPAEAGEAPQIEMELPVDVPSGGGSRGPQ
jgi:hypothetical protein